MESIIISALRVKRCASRALFVIYRVLGVLYESLLVRAGVVVTVVTVVPENLSALAECACALQPLDQGP